MSVLAVAHRVLVRVEALFECRSGEASVVLLGVLRTNSGPVNNRLDQAFTVHWAVCFHSAVALRRAACVVRRRGLTVNYSAVVLSDDSSHIWHATITNLQRVRVEDGLRITIQTNLKVADFLDLSLNLSTESFYPFRKPNDQPLYIHHQSNHPPNIIRNLPASISRRLTDISSNKDVFADAKPLYDKALRESGFSAEMEYLERRKEQGRANRRTRSQKVI